MICILLGKLTKSQNQTMLKPITIYNEFKIWVTIFIMIILGISFIKDLNYIDVYFTIIFSNLMSLTILFIKNYKLFLD